MLIEQFRRICRQAVIFHERSFYVFGGANALVNDRTDKIVRLNTATLLWSQVRNLVTPRRAHAVAFDGLYFLVVGGRDTNPTEKCSLTSNRITCVSQVPTLTDYSYYPELFMVNESFCTEWPTDSNFQ